MCSWTALIGFKTGGGSNDGPVRAAIKTGGGSNDGPVRAVQECSDAVHVYTYKFVPTRFLFN